jgi:hypothetical protein
MVKALINFGFLKMGLFAMAACGRPAAGTAALAVHGEE